MSDHNLCKHHTATFNQGDLTFNANVSPCSWMHDNYGLQVEIRMKGGGSIYRHTKKPFSECTVADFDELTKDIHIVSCRECGSPAFDSSKENTNRDSLCESCFLKKLDAEFAQPALKKLKAQQGKAYKDGYRSHVVAWVHPAQGGSDYQIDYYYQDRPTEAMIKARLRAERSMDVDDFKVQKLTPPEPVRKKRSPRRK